MEEWNFKFCDYAAGGCKGVVTALREASTRGWRFAFRAKIHSEIGYYSGDIGSNFAVINRLCIFSRYYGEAARVSLIAAGDTDFRLLQHL